MADTPNPNPTPSEDPTRLTNEEVLALQRDGGAAYRAGKTPEDLPYSVNSDDPRERLRAHYWLRGFKTALRAKIDARAALRLGRPRH